MWYRTQYQLTVVNVPQFRISDKLSACLFNSMPACLCGNSVLYFKHCNVYFYCLYSAMLFCGLDSEHNWSCKTGEGKDGGVHVNSDGTDRTDPGQGTVT